MLPRTTSNVVAGHILSRGPLFVHPGLHSTNALLAARTISAAFCMLCNTLTLLQEAAEWQIT